MDTIKNLIEQLENKDVEFYTRFQENEWGIRYIGGGHFQKWNKNYIENEDTVEELDENGVIELFKKYSDRDWSKYLVNTTQKVPLLSVTEKNKTLEELENSVWKESTADTSMVEDALSYRKIKLKDLTVEQIRLLIGQDIGLKFLIPLALEILQTNILIEGDLYKGDLLSNVLKVDEGYWKVNKKERDYLISIWEKELPNIETCEDISMIKQELFENFEKIKRLE